MSVAVGVAFNGVLSVETTSFKKISYNFIALL